MEETVLMLELDLGKGENVGHVSVYSPYNKAAVNRSLADNRCNGIMYLGYSLTSSL